MQAPHHLRVCVARYVLQQFYKWNGALKGKVGRVVNGAKNFKELVGPWMSAKYLVEGHSPCESTLAEKVDSYGSKILFADNHHYSDDYFAADLE